MKKSLIILILSIILSFCLFGCTKNTNEQETTSEFSDTVNSQKNDINNESKIITSSVNDENLSSLTTYYHSAIKGAVIANQDGSKDFSYYQKCDNCGKVYDNTTYNHSAGSGTLTSSFKCTECGNMQEIRIKSSSE